MQPNRSSPIVSRSLVLALLAAPAVAADLVVGLPGSGAPFTSIQAAIDAAQPGDRVLVQAGAYEGAVVLAKPIELIGGFGGPSMIRAHNPFPQPVPTPLVVTGIQAGQRARVASFSLAPPLHVTQFPSQSALSVFGCAGRVELSSLTLSAHTSLAYQLGAPIAYGHVQDCAQVYATNISTPEQGAFLFAQSGQGWSGLRVLRSFASFNDCAFHGSAREWGGAGLLVEDSVVEIAKSSLRGGQATGNAGIPGEGGAGVALIGSQLRVAGGQGNELRGADAVTTGLFGPALGLASSAIAGDAASSVVHAADVAPQGGAGAGSFPAALPIAPGSGPVLALAHRLPVLSFDPALGMPGAPLAVNVEGEPGTKVLRFLSLATGPAFTLPGFGGSALLDLATLSILGGTLLDASGNGTVNGTVPLDPAFAGMQFLEQGVQVLPSSLDVSVPAQITVSS